MKFEIRFQSGDVPHAGPNATGFNEAEDRFEVELVTLDDLLSVSAEHALRVLPVDDPEGVCLPIIEVLDDEDEED